MSYSINWNNAAVQVITAGLDQVPVVGDLLSHLLEIFWPESQEDIWAQIKDKVTALVDQKITTDDFNRLQAVLGSVSQGGGLQQDMQNFLNAVSTTNNNGEDPKDTWNTANGNFTTNITAFEQDGLELLLLPMFAQVANLHLTLLRDGLALGFCNVSPLRTAIQTYSAHAQKWVKSGHSARAVGNKGFNYLNVFDRDMQTSVLNFSGTWQYFDPTKFPPPVKSLVFPDEIYYTITEMIPSDNGNYDYTLQAAPDGLISSIGVFWLQDIEDNYNLVQGTQLTYDPQGGMPYSGVLVEGGLPPVSQPCDPDNDYYCYNVQPVAVGADNPVTSVSGTYEITGGTYCVDFTFLDGSSTGMIPGQNSQDYPQGFQITPPSGYYLTSIWVPTAWSWYNAAHDMVFGFRLNPVNINSSGT